ncbi:MAG: ATP-binding protein [Acidobacteria bacterium]|nr:ATP-binding protein [Acidobacteriota bacterium]
MQWVRRVLEQTLLESASAFPALILTGPRRTGKTEALRDCFGVAEYVLLEDPDTLARVRSDPRGFLADLSLPVIIDEIQNAPELFGYLRAAIDRTKNMPWQWFLTGSQEAPLMKGVTESMAGRAAVFQMLPFSRIESDKVTMLRGGFPEVLAKPKFRDIWFSSYLQTYFERDVRALVNVRDLATFRRFLTLTASRHGQVLNRTDLAAPLGISVPTVSAWLNTLETTGHILLVPPYFANFGKRLTKSPKLYWTDSGLLCHLLGIRTGQELERSPFLGAIFEGFIAAELVKSQINRGLRRELYFFRDEQGLEVDFLFPGPKQTLWLIECKAGHTVVPSMAKSVLALARAAKETTKTRCIVVHRRLPGAPKTTALAPGAEAVDMDDLIKLVNR